MKPLIFLVFLTTMVTNCFAEQKLGSLSLIRKKSALEVIYHEKLVSKAEILEGGLVWPWVTVDDSNFLNIGKTRVNVFDFRKIEKINSNEVELGEGAFIFNVSQKGFSIKNKEACSFSYKDLGFFEENESTGINLFYHRNIYLFSKSGVVYGLIRYNENKKRSETEYKTIKITLDQCSVELSESLGNPDLLVEYGHSSNFFWLTGSIEGSLFFSKDGLTWKAIELPDTLYGIVSAYIESENEIWLAAGYSGIDFQSRPMIIKSNDGGKSWKVTFDSFSNKNRVPIKWIEGILRLNPKNF